MDFAQLWQFASMLGKHPLYHEPQIFALQNKILDEISFVNHYKDYGSEDLGYVKFAENSEKELQNDMTL